MALILQRADLVIFDFFNCFQTDFSNLSCKKSKTRRLLETITNSKQGLCRNQIIKFSDINSWKRFSGSSPNSKCFLNGGLRGPVAILSISRDTCSDSIAKSFRACFCGGIAQLSRDMLQDGLSHKYASVKLSTKGGYRTILGSANLPEKVSCDMGYRSDSIAVSRDMGYRSDSIAASREMGATKMGGG